MIENKIARICWNTNLWQKPSGMNGKVKSKSYEAETGYGHEEWLFDKSKLIDGYHYSHIQAIGQHKNKYLGNKYNISLYSINSKTKERWWLGEIKDVEVVTDKESKKIYGEYKKRHWLKEMHEQLKDASANVSEFKAIRPEDFSCIKYKIKNLHILDEPRKFSSNDPAVKSDYYNLKNMFEKPSLENNQFKFKHGHTDGKRKTKSIYKSHRSETDLLHNHIQNVAYRFLSAKHGEKNIGTEQPTGLGTMIDIVQKKGGNYIFYEIKTSNTIKSCLREALSQLMEYAYYPNNKRAIKLVVISPNKITNDAKTYLNKLRKKFKLPLHYQQFDVEKNELNEKVY